jgi:osmotically-inducible protein OsmY
MHAFGSAITRPRSDRDIARIVENVLWWTGYWRDNIINVTVEKGWVTLTGEVEWGYQKRLAVPVIKDLSGIVGITDNLVVRYGPVKTPEGHVDDAGGDPDKESSSRWS